MAKKPSKRKMMKASNNCCPIIRVKCGLSKGKRTAVKSYDYRDKGKFEMVGAGRKVCSITMAGKTKGRRGMSVEETEKKVASLKNDLLGRRCQAVVEHEAVHGPVRQNGLMGLRRRRR